jgi:hypothetical protein
MRAFIYVVGFVAGAFGLWLLVLCLSILAGAVELHVNGSFVGNGSQSLVLVGDNLTAFWDGRILNVTAVST